MSTGREFVDDREPAPRVPAERAVDGSPFRAASDGGGL
jgi:hypothetical protein